MPQRFALLIAALVVSSMFTACHDGGVTAEPVTTGASTSTAAPAAAIALERPSPYELGATGYAISWPQCGSAYPKPPFDFGIVGVTGGWAFKPNPCLEDEYRWATQGRDHVAFYINMNYDESSQPALMSDIVRTCIDNLSCRAYLYGAAAAQDAYLYAASKSASAEMWWLDVQIVSEWSADTIVNAASIKGAIEFLSSRGIRVGISSTPYQWKTVAGSDAPGLPGWVAGAADRNEAQTYCDGAQDFGGGRTEQIAYVESGYEMVRACGPSAEPRRLELPLSSDPAPRPPR